MIINKAIQADLPLWRELVVLWVMASWIQKFKAIRISNSRTIMVLLETRSEPANVGKAFGQVFGASWHIFLIIILLLSPTFAATVVKSSLKPYVLGDSIGVGISLVSNWPRLAENSIAIRSSKALQQLINAPAGATVILSLGTNDSVGSVKNIEPAISRLLDKADQRHIKLVWVGPPCVFKNWNSNVETLDEILHRELEGRAIYVSLSNDTYCVKSIRARDGVHFTIGGYKKILAQIQLAIGQSN